MTTPTDEHRRLAVDLLRATMPIPPWEGVVEPVAQLIADAEQRERAKVVAWLRKVWPWIDADLGLAIGVERGDHDGG